MKEKILKDFFNHKITVDFLSDDLKDSLEKTGFDTTTVRIDQIKDSGEFEITIDHLLRLCKNAIDGNLNMTGINIIAFSLITSEYFTWDSDSKNGKIIETVIYDWDNPEIGHDLTIENMIKWKNYLITGNYNFYNNIKTG